VPQRSEPEGSPGLGADDISRTRHQADLRKDEGRDMEIVEAEQPQPHGASNEASREKVLQGDESEGSPGSCRRAQHQVDLLQRAGAAVSKKRRQPSGSKRTQQPSVRVARQGRATSSAGGKWPARLPRGSRAGLRRTQYRLRPRRARAEVKETRAISGTRIATVQSGQVLPTEGASGPKGGIQTAHGIIEGGLWHRGC
jgi:hypothetical protein